MRSKIQVNKISISTNIEISLAAPDVQMLLEGLTSISAPNSSKYRCKKRNMPWKSRSKTTRNLFIRKITIEDYETSFKDYTTKSEIIQK